MLPLGCAVGHGDDLADWRRLADGRIDAFAFAPRGFMRERRRQLEGPSEAGASARHGSADKVAGSINLGTTQPFALGPLSIRPSTREVQSGDRPAVLAEPRVLQVLIALAQARGAVVTRDQLIALC